jgi:cold shock CspA family protein
MSDTTVPNTTATTTASTVQLQTITVPDGPRFIARVKWFDNTLSYGFATVTSGEHAGRDIFVHQSNILTLTQGIYRTLRMGEYIEFNIEDSTDSSHRYQAIAVTGPGAGQLMCESNPRRPRTFQPRTQTQENQTVQQSAQVGATNQYGDNKQQSRTSRPRRSYRQAPIQVVVEYPNPPRQQQHRTRQPRANNGQTTAAASASAATNIASTLAAGN